MLELAYVAGLFDGEGSITLVKTKPWGHAVSPKYGLQVDVTNTYLGVLLELKEMFGGSVQTKPRKNLKHTQGYYWRIGTQIGKNFLEKLLPYLIIKKDRALLAIQYCNAIHRGTKSCLSMDEMALRDAFRQEMQRLNNRTKIN